MKIFEKIGEHFTNWVATQTYETIGEKVGGAIFLTGVIAALLGNSMNKRTIVVDTRKCDDDIIDITDTAVVETEE